MRILILTQYYLPETGAPQNRLSDLAVRFHRAGHEVRVLTAKPNYPIGTIYQGFEKGFSQKTIQKGVPVTHCWIFPSNRNLFHRLINYFSFVFSSCLVGLLQLPKLDLIIVESPPLFLSISGCLISRLKGAKMILNVSDLYPETAVSLGLLNNKLIIRLFLWFENWSYKIASAVTCQTKGILNSIKNRFPNERVHLLTNGIDIDLIQSVNVVENKQTNEFIIGYAGVIGYGQNLSVLVEPAVYINNFPSIRFHIYGDGPEKEILLEQIKALSIQNIELLGHFPHLDILKKMQTWHIGLVSLANKPLMSGALPSKMFEMMALKLPILLIAPKGEASEIIETANAGIWVSPDSPSNISKAILKLYHNPDLRREHGQNAYNYVRVFFNRQIIFNDFCSFLTEENLLS